MLCSGPLPCLPASSFRHNLTPIKLFLCLFLPCIRGAECGRGKHPTVPTAWLSAFEPKPPGAGLRECPAGKRLPGADLPPLRQLLLSPPCSSPHPSLPFSSLTAEVEVKRPPACPQPVLRQRPALRHRSSPSTRSSRRRGRLQTPGPSRCRTLPCRLLILHGQSAVLTSYSSLNSNRTFSFSFC